MIKVRNTDLLEKVIANTNDFLANVPKSQRKKMGQFFTPASIARYMARLFTMDLSKKSLNILDPGAGTGILAAALVDRILASGYKGNIHLVCYENDPIVLPVLEKNLCIIREAAGIKCEIKKENYITSQTFGEKSLFADDSCRYDYVIGNPPYMKIPKDAPEAKSMQDVCHGAPNLYFLFWAMGVYNLRQGCELVYIVPRSWTSGAYFRRFRQYLFDNAVLTDIHLFESRDKVFDDESVLQETIIVKVKKTTSKPDCVHITTSSTSRFDDVCYFDAPYSIVVSSDGMVFLVANSNDAETLRKINALPMTLPAINMKMQTGLIVDFRTRGAIRNDMVAGSFPLLYSSHIKDGLVVWPIGREGEVILTDKSSYLQSNSDMLIVKRFTSKEEPRRLQCGIFLKQRYRQFKYVSTQNKVNFIKCDSPCITYGLYVLLNSSLYDAYYRVLNGSTQVNSTEINQMPIPERSVIEAMGRELMHHDLSVSNCNDILDRWIK